MKRILAFAAVLLVSACGIQPTPVVQAGFAPTKRNTASPEVTVYFVEAGRIVAAPRVVSGGTGLDNAMNLLFKGPTDTEAKRGLYTELPQPGRWLAQSAPGAEIAVPYSLGELSELGIDQIVCTASAALASSGTATEITVVAADGRLGPRSCQGF